MYMRKVVLLAWYVKFLGGKMYDTLNLKGGSGGQTDDTVGPLAVQPLLKVIHP